MKSAAAIDREVVTPVALAEERLLPVVPELEGALPGGALRRGTIVSVAGSHGLALRLVAGASAAGSWVGAVALGDLGLVAAGELGVDLSRFALVPDPGEQWAAVTAALVDALDIVLVGLPSGQVRAADARRLTARARERGAVLIPVLARPQQWAEGADVRLDVVGHRFAGIHDGHGHLEAVTLEITTGGRGAAARPRELELVLGSPLRGNGNANGSAIASQWREVS